MGIDITNNETPQAEEQPTLADSLDALYHRILGTRREQLACTLIMLNLILWYVRPQDSFVALRVIYPLAIVNLLCIPFWLARRHLTWTTQAKAMLALIVIGAIWVPFARNNRWALWTVQDLAISFACLVFPIIVCFPHAKQLRRLANLLVFIGAYLGIYGIMHSGKGPSQFLGDENDLCVALDMLLPFTLLLLPVVSPAKRLLYIGCAGVILTGIVTTQSRGGFLGLLVTLTYIFLRSQRKVMMVCLGVVMLFAAALFVPSDYWKEMDTIRQTDQGTAKARREIWGLAFKIFIDPPHIPFGVGMANSTRYIADYESASAFSNTGTTYSGRAIHSMYFQLLADLGLSGAFILLITFLTSWRFNSQRMREAKELQADAAAALDDLSDRFEDDSPISAEDAQEMENASVALSDISREAEFSSAFSRALNGSWLGVLASGGFVSIFYYPNLWVLAGICSALQLFWPSFRESSESVIERVHRPVSRIG